LLLEQLLQGLLLIRRALQEQQDAAHGYGVTDRTTIKFGACERMGVTSKGERLPRVDRLRNPSGGNAGLSQARAIAKKE
jgi:hypothetical protein